MWDIKTSQFSVWVRHFEKLRIELRVVHSRRSDIVKFLFFTISAKEAWMLGWLKSKCGLCKILLKSFNRACERRKSDGAMLHTDSPQLALVKLFQKYSTHRRFELNMNHTWAKLENHVQLCDRRVPGRLFCAAAPLVVPATSSSFWTLRGNIGNPQNSSIHGKKFRKK